MLSNRFLGIWSLVSASDLGKYMKTWTQNKQRDQYIEIMFTGRTSKFTWGFPKNGGIPISWMFYNGKIPIYKWMKTGGTPILGHIHMKHDQNWTFFQVGPRHSPNFERPPARNGPPSPPARPEGEVKATEQGRGDQGDIPKPCCITGEYYWIFIITIDQYNRLLYRDISKNTIDSNRSEY